MKTKKESDVDKLSDILKDNEDKLAEPKGSRASISSALEHQKETMQAQSETLDDIMAAPIPKMQNILESDDNSVREETKKELAQLEQEDKESNAKSK